MRDNEAINSCLYANSAVDWHAGSVLGYREVHQGLDEGGRTRLVGRRRFDLFYIIYRGCSHSSYGQPMITRMRQGGTAATGRLSYLLSQLQIYLYLGIDRATSF